MSEDYYYVPIWTNDISHLGIIRSLGLSGKNYHSLQIGWPSMPKPFSGYSKFIQGYTHIGNPYEDLYRSIYLAKKKCQALVSDISKLRFIPSSDTAQIFLDYLLHALGLNNSNAHPCGLTSRYRDSFDKSYHENIVAETPGIISLKTTFDSPDFPKILKPAKKDLGNSFARIFGTKALSIRSPAELANLDLRGFRKSDLVVQRLIDWEDWSEVPCYFYFENGKALFSSAVKKHCIFPQPSGTSYLLEHVEVAPTLHNAGQRLGGRLRWNGPLMIEFAHHIDRLPALIEINTRPWLLNESFRQRGTDYVTGCIEPADWQGVSGSSSIWTRGICSLIARGEKVEGLDELIEKKTGTPLRDADYFDEDPSPFEQSILHFSDNRHTRSFIDKVLKLIEF